MLEIAQLTKRFGADTAVDAVSFSLDQATMLGVIGRSGAGKSTLLRMINRLIDADGGVMRFDGRDVLAMRGGAVRAWRSECAMVFQQFNLVPRLDALTNVLLGRLRHHSTIGAALRLFTRAERLAAFEALDRLGVAEHAAKRVESLSGGQQQRVAIARALVQKPKMILADEPIASLDPMNAKIVMDALRRIHEEDRLTIICNLHTLDTARAYCDRVIGMRAGRMVFDGAAAALTPEAAREIYGADASFEESVTSTTLRPDAAPLSADRPAFAV